MKFVVEQTTREGWIPVAMFVFRYDAKFFAEEYGRVQPKVRFRVVEAQ